MDSYDARSKFDKIDSNPSLDTASSEYDKLYSLMDEVIDALRECEAERDEAKDRVHDLENDLSDATDRIAELERQIEELSTRENS